jgi:hypothetical protein
MSFFQEYSLLFAVATPVAVVVLIEVALWLSGERGASLLPALSRYPTVMSKAEIAARFTPPAMPRPEVAAVLRETPAVAARVPVSANDRAVREAA